MYKISKKIYISDLKSVKDVLIQMCQGCSDTKCQGCSDTWHLILNSKFKIQNSLVSSHLHVQHELQEADLPFDAGRLVD